MYYENFKDKEKLHNDDLRQLRELYGSLKFNDQTIEMIDFVEKLPDTKKVTIAIGIYSDWTEFKWIFRSFFLATIEWRCFDWNWKRKIWWKVNKTLSFSELPPLRWIRIKFRHSISPKKKKNLILKKFHSSQMEYWLKSIHSIQQKNMQNA